MTVGEDTLFPSQDSLSSQDVLAVLNAHISRDVSRVRGTGPAVPQLAGIDHTASFAEE